MSHRGIALLALLAAGCGREPPPAPSLHALTGHVRLTGQLFDADARHLGTRVVGNADGIPVDLLFGDRVVASTVTVDGVYRFEGLAPGAYVARVEIAGALRDHTVPLTIAGFDLAAADTLRLTPRGDLLAAPNPRSPSTRFYFEMPDTQRVEIDILDLGGRRVRRIVSLTGAHGLRTVLWNGLDQEGRVAADSFYWASIAAGDDLRSQLLFR